MATDEPKSYPLSAFDHIPSAPEEATDNPRHARPTTLEEQKETEEAEANAPVTPMDVAMAAHRAARAAAPDHYSIAVHVTNGPAPQTGTMVSIRSGRFDTESNPNPDEAEAARERQVIRDAIKQWIAGEDPTVGENIAVDSLVDDIVAALAGE